MINQNELTSVPEILKPNRVTLADQLIKETF